ncbi:uncharacterized protein [Chironomus tepperi]|uniref:uncharacterized protein n=1 Tax=Chironomus tepperi TaxID=113505 RepID=UPI00391FBC5C
MPSSYSKLFSDNFVGITCTDIVHPGQSCSQFILKYITTDLIIGSLKFYFPVCLTSLLVNVKRWNQPKTWTDFLKLLTKCFVFAAIFSISIFGGLCLEYKILKKFHYHLIIWLPTFVGTFASIILPPAIMKAESLAMFNFYIEYIIKSSNSEAVQKLKRSLLSGTVVFAAFNALVMCGMLKARCPNFWFSKFKYSKDKEATNICQKIHSNLTCTNYLIKEIKEASTFALGFCIIKSILTCLGKLNNGPMGVLKIFFKSFDFKLFSFIAGIDGVFKTIFCLLNQKTSFSPLTNCGISSFLGGLTYAFFPRYEIFTLAISNAIATFYQALVNCYEKEKKEMPIILKGINKLPIYYLLIILSVPTLMHNRLFFPYNVNKTVSNFLRVGSNGKDRDVIYRGISTFFGYKIK